MNQNMTAIDWLDKEHLQNINIPFKPEVCSFVHSYASSIVMERFANNKTAELQAMIFDFRNDLYKASLSETKEAEEAGYWLELFDKSFGIKKLI